MSEKAAPVYCEDCGDVACFNAGRPLRRKGLICLECSMNYRKDSFGGKTYDEWLADQDAQRTWKGVRDAGN